MLLSGLAAGTAAGDGSPLTDGYSPTRGYCNVINAVDGKTEGGGKSKFGDDVATMTLSLAGLNGLFHTYFTLDSFRWISRNAAETTTTAAEFIKPFSVFLGVVGAFIESFIPFSTELAEALGLPDSKLKPSANKGADVHRMNLWALFLKRFVQGGAMSTKIVLRAHKTFLARPYAKFFDKWTKFVYPILQGRWSLCRGPSGASRPPCAIRSRASGLSARTTSGSTRSWGRSTHGPHRGGGARRRRTDGAARRSRRIGSCFHVGHRQGQGHREAGHRQGQGHREHGEGQGQAGRERHQGRRDRRGRAGGPRAASPVDGAHREPQVQGGDGPYAAGLFARLRARAAFDWTNAYLFVMAAKAACRDRGVAAKSMREMALPTFTWLNEGNLEGLGASDARDVVISFRGTEFTSLRDIATDLDVTSAAESGGQIQKGTQRAVARVLPPIFAALETHEPKRTKLIWVSGHSLGGAIAVLTALRLKTEKFNVRPVYTGGEFRVGDRAFMDRDPVALHRVANENGPVTYLPLVLKGAGQRSDDHVHGGKLFFIDVAKAALTA